MQTWKHGHEEDDSSAIKALSERGERTIDDRHSMRIGTSDFKDFSSLSGHTHTVTVRPIGKPPEVMHTLNAISPKSRGQVGKGHLWKMTFHGPLPLEQLIETDWNSLIAHTPS